VRGRIDLGLSLQLMQNVELPRLWNWTACLNLYPAQPSGFFFTAVKATAIAIPPTNIFKSTQLRFLDHQVMQSGWM
jgi:hypothetical protein